MSNEQTKHRKSAVQVKRLRIGSSGAPSTGVLLESDSGALKVNGVTFSTTELGFLDGVTAGTVTASKALVASADKDITELRNLGADRLDLNATQGASGSYSILVVRKAGIADNTATDVITVTVPNGEHNAAIYLDILAHLGTGTDLSESSRCATGVVVLARKTGADTVAVVSTLAQAQIATTSGGATLTLAYGVSAMTGAAGATQTFTIQVTLVKTGTVDNHVAVIAARLLNSAAAGVTVAAS
jgi:hypothetical protein